MKLTPTLLYLMILLSLVATLTAGPALAKQQGPTDPNELEAFLDEHMAA